MRLKALTLHRYRAFKEKYRINLAPTTVIIGKNGSGKSLLARLPLLLSSALSENPEGPLDLSAGGVEHAASFLDLINLRSALPFSLGVEITGEEPDLAFETTLRYVNETRSLAIESFVLREQDSVIFTADISGEEQLASSRPVYSTSSYGSEARPQELRFSGLFPLGEALDGRARDRLSSALELFRRALPTPSYLGPFRAEAGSSMRMPNQSIKELGSRGERALELLADDRLRRGGALAQQVSDWFANSMGPKISVDVGGDDPKVFVSDASSGFNVSLSDTGAGFSQALPIVVQHFAYRTGRLNSPVLIVEQPELHLHPAAHGALADLILTTSEDTPQWKGAICIVETHSEQFIMRLRRRIAEGHKSSQIALLSLNHIDSADPAAPVDTLREISFDQRGNPNSWPFGVFEETLTDLTAMRQSARDRKL